MPPPRSSSRKSKGTNPSRGDGGTSATSLHSAASSKQMHYSLKIFLHVKSTAVKANPATDIAIVTCPFEHSGMQKVSSRLSFDQVIDKIKLDVIKSEEFQNKFGTVHFDSARGIVGWKGKRKDNENPKAVLMRKAAIELKTTKEWKDHLNMYGVKYQHKEKDSRKFIVIDIGLAVYRKESTKTSGKRQQSTKVSSTAKSAASKKTKKNTPSVFRAPKMLSIAVLGPVEHHAKEAKDKTTGVDHIGIVNVNFDDLVLWRRDSDSHSDSEESMDTTSLMDREEQDDVVKIHTYERIRHALACTILDDATFKAYHGKIGDKVRPMFIIN